MEPGPWATVRTFVATYWFPNHHSFTNVPDLQDVRTMGRLLETLGAQVERRQARARVQVPRVPNDVAAYELVSTMRASVLVLGPLVARHGTARVALPGGCAIGVRPSA